MPSNLLQTITCPRAKLIDFAGLKARRIWLAPYLFLLAPVSVANAQEAREGGAYAGVFGGIVHSQGQSVEQTGVAHRRDEWRLEGYRDFDLPVAVAGRSKSNEAGAFGIQIGYEFPASRHGLRPAVELEYAHYSTQQSANLRNPATEQAVNIATGGPNAMLADPSDYVAEHYAAGNHRFQNRVNVNFDTIMLSGLVALDTRGRITPYAGLGIGVAFATAKNAVSLQTNPGGPVELTSDTDEPVNHFNSRPRDRTSALAVQARAGIRIEVTAHVSAFAEYRLLRVSETRFDFGSTRYTGHPPTDDWVVRQEPAMLHSGLIGLRYSF